MRLVVVYQDSERGWGRRIARFISSTAPECWLTTMLEMPPIRAPIIDDPEPFLPPELPETDLLLVLAEGPGLGQLVPDLADICGPEVVLVPVDNERWMPRGLRNQVSSGLGPDIEVAFPSPFCSLTAHSGSSGFFRRFAACYGRPTYRVECRGDRVVRAEVERSAPCGNGRYIARRLEGTPCDEAPRRAGLDHQLYPCLAAVDLIHDSAHITEAAVMRALAASDDNHQGGKDSGSRASETGMVE